MQGDIYGTDDPASYRCKRGHKLFASFDFCRECAAWNDDTIQFPRFIAECEMAGVFTPENVNDMCASMDITSDQWSEIVDRAQLAWEKLCSAQRHPSNG